MRPKSVPPMAIQKVSRFDPLPIHASRFHCSPFSTVTAILLALSYLENSPRVKKLPNPAAVSILAKRPELALRQYGVVFRD